MSRDTDRKMVRSIIEMLGRRRTLLLEDYGILASDEDAPDYETTKRDLRLKKSGAIDEVDIIIDNLKDALIET